MHPTPRTRPLAGFTIIELLVVVALISALVMFLVISSNGGRTRLPARQLKDSTQVRGIVQAMVVWAANNNGSYPLPSMLDTSDATVPEQGEAKNTTANILSVLIFNGNISPEICITPAEANTAQIQRKDDYLYTAPSGAQRSADALWDPSFKGTPDDPPTYANLPSAGIGHQSYAHLLPFGNRRKQWSDTYVSTEAVFGNRGPTYAASDAAAASNKWSLLPGPLGTASNTLLIHGGPKTWEGNIGYNDNHVNFEVKGAPDTLTLSVPGAGKGTKASMPDNLFVNETDEVDGDGTSGRIDSGTNAYLRSIAEVRSPTRPRVWRD